MKDNSVKMGRKSKELSNCCKNEIVKLFKQGLSYRYIGKKVGYSHSTVQYIINKFKTGSVDNKKHTGRKRLLTVRESREIVKKAQKNSKISARDLATHIASSFGKTVTPQTVRNRLHEAGYRGRAARKKPFINERNRKKRLEFARRYVNKPLLFWKNVLFSDESKYNIFGSDGRRFVWRKKGKAFEAKNLQPTVKHGGGNVMVWGCMSASGVGELAIIDGIMNAERYVDVLRGNLRKSVQKLGIEGNYLFQQDNDPKHTANKTKEWLLYNVRQMLPTPPQSPDLNPIENLWALLELKIRKYTSSSRKELICHLKKAWAEIDPQETNNLVESMPRRLQAVINAKGFPTKY